MRALFWVLFACMAGVYLAMALWTLPAVAAMAGGLTPFDLRPGGYTHEEAVALVAALGAEGRDYYLNVQQGLDSVYPALMAVVLAMALRWAWAGWTGRALALVAVAAGAFDYLENAAVAAMLRAGPEAIAPEMAAAASRWTVLKSGATTAALLGLLVGLGVFLWRRR